MASTPAKKPLSERQRQLARVMDIASAEVVAYAAKEVPPIGNYTEEGLTDLFGYLNEARKELEKTEKIVRGRLEAMLAGRKESKGDNFQYKKSTTATSRLNQGKAKDTLEKLGVLDEHMDHTEQERVTVKRF